MRKVHPGIVPLILLIGGCTSVSVKHVNYAMDHRATPVGQRFSLPVPTFLVTPTGDGGVSVERKDLPDPANTFAIDGWSLFARYSLNLETKNGVLTEVKWAPDSSAVLSEALTSAGNVAGEAIRTSAAENAAENAAIDAAKLEVALADAEYKAAVALYGPQSAEAVKALVALRKAEAKLAFLLDKPAPASMIDSLGRIASDPARSQALKDRFGTAPAPMLLVLHLDKEGRPSLRPAHYGVSKTQIRVPIAGTKPAGTSPGETPAIAVAESSVVITRPATGDLIGEIKLSGKVEESRHVKLLDTATMLEHTNRVVSVTPRSDDPRKLILVLRHALPQGRYQLRFSVKVTTSSDETELTVTLVVQ